MKTATKGQRKTTGEGLSLAQHEELRRVLETKKAHLLRACEEREEVAAEVAETGDVADVAEGVIEDRQRAALDEHDRALLGEIEHALARMDEGTYGVSEKSGHPIPFVRLLSVPWARYDSDDAERVEHGLIR
jgi:DnaK suppressor protein